jgi:diguanylate cyclase (GGDEF)-like protein
MSAVAPGVLDADHLRLVPSLWRQGPLAPSAIGPGESGSPMVLPDWVALVQQLSGELAQANAALAEVRTLLAGTQAGERRARHQALHDGLTALPNRAHFRDSLAQALCADAGPVQLTLFVIDLDGFKQVNDQHGHDAGDELLCIIAARLHRAVRAEDMVARLGGDEFACLLHGVNDRQTAQRVACKVFDAVSAPVKIGDVCLAVRPSIGIARCPQGGAAPEVLLKQADLAMYQAKRGQTGYAFADTDPGGT